ncbi:hypothetical protein ACFFOS_27535 [Nocardioides kongjuensis]|uniref:PD-(D/E)XK endonuclease-like domain-containing protein n=1 Tax=Nocardioides kongjuensis TaxID=349522 RepID=A0A852RXG5_9ACTN|nr:hypothetical protein [Nocardioides kongjuensis]NYD33876.1 hypothetical protein [Nocardioides kongjuensis]
MTATKTRPRLTRKDWLINGKTSHSYLLDCDCRRYTSTDPHKVPGVTTILSALPGPPPSWGADVAAKIVLNEWDQVAEMPALDRYEYLKGAPDRYMNEAAERGTKIHKMGEALAWGEAPDVPDEIRGPVEAYARLLDDWQVEPVATEFPVAMTPERAAALGIGSAAWAGTADLAARIGVRDNAFAYIDVKTGNSVQNKTGLQLTGYDFADLWQPDGPESETTDKPRAELMYVAHIGPDSARMLPVTLGGLRELKYLAYLRMSMRWQQDHDWWYRKRGPEPLIGEAEQP